MMASAVGGIVEDAVFQGSWITRFGVFLFRWWLDWFAGTLVWGCIYHQFKCQLSYFCFSEHWISPLFQQFHLAENCMLISNIMPLAEILRQESRPLSSSMSSLTPTGCIKKIITIANSGFPMFEAQKAIVLDSISVPCSAPSPVRIQ